MIYQFRLTVAEISPLIWRRIWMCADQTLADLHYTIQITMDWTDCFLNQFLFRGEYYCVYKIGGMVMNSAHQVPLHDLSLRPNECIQYQYNMYVPWRVQVRYEKTVPYQSKRVYPYCVSGKYPGPVEHYSGPDEYQAKRDYYNEDYFGMKIINALIYHPEQTVAEVFDDELDLMKFWMREHRFDRKHINETLKIYSMDGKWWISL